VCALEVIGDGSFIIADASGSLVALESLYGNSDKGYFLESRAKMHLGDVVTCFARGSIMTQDDWRNPKVSKVATPLIFGCVTSSRVLVLTPLIARYQVSGAIGCIVSIDDVTHSLLERLSKVLLEFHSGVKARVHTLFCLLLLICMQVGDFDHETFQALHNNVATCNAAPMDDFIDGDIVESFLNIPRASQCHVVKRLNMGENVSETTIQQLTDMISELRHLH